MFKAIPGRVASFARGMFDAILTEFAKVANGIINLYNKIPILPDVPTIAIPQAARPSVPSSAAVRERSSSLSNSTAPIINNNTFVMPNIDPESFQPLMREDNRNNGAIAADIGFY